MCKKVEKTDEIPIEPTREKGEHFFLIKVMEATGGKKPIMIATRAKDEDDARNQFDHMRLHAPILEKNKWVIMNVFDMESESDIKTLEVHPNLNIAFYLRKTPIETYVPVDINHPLSTVELRSKPTEFVHVTRNNRNYVDKIKTVSNKIGIHLLYDGEDTLFSETQCLEQIESIIATDKNIAFILYEETIGESIKFAEAVYDMLEDKKIIVNFFYVYEDQIYEILYDTGMFAYKIYA